jgi:hypothetical protein
MRCPKCNSTMKIMCRPEADYKDKLGEHVEVLGRCDRCDFDATWEIETQYNPYRVIEYNMKRYYFG